jgi:DNA-directed RNA polymerase subunit RPC12/RpoP
VDEGKERIKCGKCQSEYSPRIEKEEKVFSCPVCGHGSFTENKKNLHKQILKDNYVRTGKVLLD